MSNQSHRVLVIEDSPHLAESLEDMLVLKNIEPIIAVTGRDGVDAALAEHPDLILLDIRLPDIDGYEVFRQIRADAWGATAKILILTASESVDVVAKNIDLDPSHVLYKPEWSIKGLLQAITERLAEPATLQQ